MTFRIDIKHKTACFPSFQGASYYSAMNELQELKYIEDNCSKSIYNFFSPASCYGVKNCRNEYAGDEGALKCLNEFGDIAFISLESYKQLNGKNNLIEVFMN